MDPIRVLSADQMARIDEAARKILDQTGMRIESEEALDVLARFGCRVVRRPAVTDADIQEPVGTELQLPAVVVGLWLHDFEDDSFA